MKVALLTISDRAAQGQREDRTGPELRDYLTAHGWQVVASAILSDDREGIEQILSEWSDHGDCDVILTAGGTGFTSRDQAPEATLAVIDRLAPGLPEAMRAQSLKITPHAMLSRAVAGIRGSTLIINLPGSPKAALENLEVVLPALPHAIQLLREAPEAEAGHRPPRPAPKA